MSSKSRSRSKHRSKRSKSSAKPSDLASVGQQKSKADEGKSNLVAMICGMVTTLLLIFGVFDLGSDPVKAEKIDSEVAKREEAREEAEREDTIEEMMIKLAELEKQKSSSFLDSISICKERIRVSNELLGRNPQNPVHKKTAITEGLLARVKLYGIDVINDLGIAGCGDDLMKSYALYLDSDNWEVRRSARVAKLTHLSFEQFKREDKNVDELVDLYEETILQFPEDDYVASMIGLHLGVLVEKEPQYTESLYRKLRERIPADSLGLVMAQQLDNISDKLLLASHGYRDKFARRWADADEGRSELVATAGRLLTAPDVGREVLVKLDRLAFFFERNSFFDEASAVYQSLANAVQAGNIREQYQDVAQKIVESGQNRAALLGKPIQYKGIDFAGKHLMADDLNQNVVVVAYWSAASKESLLFLDALNSSARTVEKKPVRILAVCIDDEMPKDLNLMKNKSSSIQLVKSTFEGQTNPLLSQCPPGTVLPHVMLINFGGIVESPNAEPKLTMDKVIGMLIKRRE